MTEETTITKEETINESVIVPFSTGEPEHDVTAETPSATEKAAEFTQKASEFTEKAAEFTSKTFQKAATHINSNENYDFPDEESTSAKRFHFKKDDKEFFRDKWILSRIQNDQLMDYLKLEQKRNELQQSAKDLKEKRILKGFQTAIFAAAIIAVVYLLKDNPSILINILYIAGILAALWFWNHSKDK